MSLPFFFFSFLFRLRGFEDQGRKAQVRSGNQISRGKFESREVKGEESNEGRVGRLELS